MAQYHQWNDDYGYDNATNVDGKLWEWINLQKRGTKLTGSTAEGYDPCCSREAREVSAKVARTSDIF